MSSIADTIRSLKPGDQVRVTREQIVGTGTNGSYVSTIVGPCIDRNDPTITSIEVIERPLAVGEDVTFVTPTMNQGLGVKGVLLGIDDKEAWVRWPGNRRTVHRLSDLRRAS